jgi:hypothetical protein
MKIFQIIQDVDIGKFFVSAIYDDEGKVNFIAIYPIANDLIYPALSFDLKDMRMQPLIDMIERKILEAN